MSVGTFLLEIGVEELPASFCAPAMEQLRLRGESLLHELRLPFAASRTLGTPRRLVWMVEGMGEQPDAEIVVRGPARAAAFGPDGTPTRAADGFARGQGCSVQDLFVEARGGKEYVFARRIEPGRPVPEVLGPALPGLIASLEFPRTMRWGAGDFRFARPIRWLVGLWKETVVPFAIGEVCSDRMSYGHRTLHPGAISLRSAEEYEGALARASVLVDPIVRRIRIWDELCQVASEVGGIVRPNEELLDEINFIVEWPTAFIGRFDPAALEVPEPVLTTVMRVHQRYFPVEDRSGGLLPVFAAVRNGDAAHLDTVRAGNERVVAARFADAHFFYDEDRKTPLSSRVPLLHSVVFAPGLGTMLQKSERIEQLALHLASEVAGGVGVRDAIAQAARLCKADRLTHLVYELPELEGTMGARYAADEGAPPLVVKAIEEYVLPRAAGDRLPLSLPGRLLAVADRIDTLTGHFLLQRMPSGSADPYGLRRAALACVRILEEAGWDVSLRTTVTKALEGYAQQGVAGNASDTVASVMQFLEGRLRGQLEDAGFRNDIVDAVLAAGSDRVADAFARCRALTSAEASPEWSDALTVFRRASRLAGECAEAATPSLSATEPAERQLVAALQAVGEAVRESLAQRDYGTVLRSVAMLRGPVDAFLTDLLVMDPDPQVRSFRLSLLHQVASLTDPVADLRRLRSGARADVTP